MKSKPFVIFIIIVLLCAGAIALTDHILQYQEKFSHPDFKGNLSDEFVFNASNTSGDSHG